MNSGKTGSSRPTVLIALVLIGVAVAAGGYYFFELMRKDRDPPTQPPSSEWTTAPEGGVEVNLPETQMTNVPVAPPIAEETDQPGTAETSLESSPPEDR